MAIFKRNDQNEAKKGEAAAAVLEADSAARPGGMAPPFVSRAAQQAPTAPGVVPPPAAPMYSMRPPQSELRFELDAESAIAGKVRAASDEAKATQEVVQRRVRMAVQRSRSEAAATNGVRRAAASSGGALRLPVRQSFDPVRAAQAGLLNLAWSWQEAGAPIRAIHTYMQLLCRYPDTPAAAAAVADLVELSDSLAAAGQFHIALAIYDQLEELV